MEALYVLLSIGFLILQIFMIDKFLQIATNIKTLKEIQMVNFKRTYFESSEYLQQVEAVEDIELPEVNYGFVYKDSIKFRFGDSEEQAIYKELGYWCCYNNAGQTVYAISKDEAIKFCYYFSTKK